MVQKVLLPIRAADIRHFAVLRLYVVAGKVPSNDILQPLQPSTLVDWEHDLVFVLAKLGAEGSECCFQNGGWRHLRIFEADFDDCGGFEYVQCYARYLVQCDLGKDLFA